MGGIRIDLDNGMVTDIGYTMTGSTYSYFADLYYGSYGIAISGSNAVSLASASLMFGAEASISDSVTLGIALPLITWNDGINDLTFFGNFDVYGVIAF